MLKRSKKFDYDLKDLVKIPLKNYHLKISHFNNFSKIES